VRNGDTVGAFREGLGGSRKGAGLGTMQRAVSEVIGEGEVHNHKPSLDCDAHTAISHRGIARAKVMASSYMRVRVRVRVRGATSRESADPIAARNIGGGGF
jgi:hypothetical protein